MDALLIHFFFQVYDLSHPNLVKFIGASIDVGDVRLYTEYCMKGGLPVGKNNIHIFHE